jgi:hypothetical protein
MTSQPSAARVLSESLAVAGVAGVATGLLLGMWTAELNEIGSLAEVGALCLELTALYVAAFAVGLVGLALAALVLGRRPGARFFAACALAASVLMNGLVRYNQTIQPLSVTPHLSLVGIGQLVGVLAIAALGFAAVLHARSRAALPALLAAFALLAGMEAVQRWHERPLRRDLGALVPALVRDAPRAFTPRVGERFDDARLVVLGIDGLGFEVVLPLLRRGDAPNLAWLLDHAAYGYLDTLPIPISPVIWETISTGQPPTRHRIGHHSHWIFPGLADRVRFLPAFPIADSTVFGIRRLLTLTSPWAPWEIIYHDATDAGAARLWEILDRAGLSVGSYKWMNSAPVSRVRGFMKGYEPVEPRLWPPDLEQGFAELPEPSQVIPRERGLWERFLALAQRHRPQALFYYTHFADAENHWHWKRDAVGDGLFHTGLRHVDFVPGPEITRASHVVDAMIGDVLARLPEDATLVVISDHGFEFRGYEHDHSPPGVILVLGPSVRPGAIARASVYDVAPTLLHLLGLPVAADMPGRVLPIWKAGAPQDRAPLTVRSYGNPAEPIREGEADPEEMERTREYLRSLGYVN